MNKILARWEKIQNGESEELPLWFSENFDNARPWNVTTENDPRYKNCRYVVEGYPPGGGDYYAKRPTFAMGLMIKLWRDAYYTYAPRSERVGTIQRKAMAYLGYIYYVIKGRESKKSRFLILNAKIKKLKSKGNSVEKKFRK